MVEQKDYFPKLESWCQQERVINVNVLLFLNQNHLHVSDFGLGKEAH